MGALHSAMSMLLSEGGYGTEGAPAPPPKQLPPCILDNREPFAHKTWRRAPYEPRPYERLHNYANTTNVPSEVMMCGVHCACMWVMMGGGAVGDCVGTCKSLLAAFKPCNCA